MQTISHVPLMCAVYPTQNCHACPILSGDADWYTELSPSFQNSIDRALQKPRLSCRDHEGWLAVYVSDVCEERKIRMEKAAIVGRLVTQGQDELGIGRSPNAQDIDRAKMFLRSSDGTIWREYIQG